MTRVGSGNRHHGAFLGAMLFVVAACAAPAPIGGVCSHGADCASGLCASAGTCVEPCGVDADCAAGVCAGVASASRFCVADCTAPLASGYYCAGGTPHACSEAGAQLACSTCGCPSGMFCSIGSQACESPRDVGQPCTSNQECVSGNCGYVAGDEAICFVAPGAACTPENCGECATLPDGTTQCQQVCASSTACGLEADLLCWGSFASEDGFYCRRRCDPFTAGSCGPGFTCRDVRTRDFVEVSRCFPDDVSIGPASFACPSGGMPDGCGTCDTDASNDCSQDCAGHYGGSATVDMCGTCDADATNDCAQDCAGAWGGSAMLDPCGTCDTDPTNDCICDPCGSCDTDPTNDCVTSCTYGQHLLGGCWFIGLDGDSCSGTCSRWGGRYSEQTRRVAGSDGQNAWCQMISDAWGGTTTSVSTGFASVGLGCARQTGAVFSDPERLQRHVSVPTSGNAYALGYHRVCACDIP